MGEGEGEIRREPQTSEDDFGPFLEALGEEVVVQRKFLGLLQNELADIAGCCRRTVVLLETGRRMPAVAKLWELARALDLEFSELMDLARQRMEAASASAPISYRSPTAVVAGSLQ